MEHVPGQLDFSIVEKEFPVTAFLRKISSICAFVETPGHVAVITRRGKRECALVSIETYDRADRADDPGLYQRRHVRHHRYHILDATLRLTLATWESETNSLSANFLKAIARIIAVFGGALREDIFKEHVGRCSVKSIIRTAKERRPGVLGYAEAMLIAYNAKNKYRLPIKKLYGSQRDEELDDEETDDDTAAI